MCTVAAGKAQYLQLNLNDLVTHKTFDHQCGSSQTSASLPQLPSHTPKEQMGKKESPNDVTAHSDALDKDGYCILF